MKKSISSQSLLLNAANKKIAGNGIIKYIKKSVPLIAAFLLLNSSVFSMGVTHKNVKSVSKEKAKELKREEREQKREMRGVENIPLQVMENFTEDHPQATNIGWSYVDGYNEANFTLKGKREIAFYDDEGELLGTQTILSKNALPANGVEKIGKDYKNYTIENVLFYDDNESNDDNLSIYGYNFGSDDYYAMLKDNNSGKEIVLQINPDGGIYYIGRVE